MTFKKVSSEYKTFKLNDINRHTFNLQIDSTQKIIYLASNFHMLASSHLNPPAFKFTFDAHLKLDHLKDHKKDV